MSVFEASSGIIEPKRGANVGRVVVEIVIKNVEDVRRVERGEMSPAEVRQVIMPALVDSGATFMCLPEDVIVKLGLPFNRERDTRTVVGPMKMKVFGGARLEVQDRHCDVEIMSLSSERQALLGQLPLEAMDFWIDPVNQKLVGNPEHGGEWMAEVF